MSSSGHTIQILGASGYLGSGATEYLKGQGHQVVTDRIDVTDRRALERSFATHRPDVVINCAGVRTEPNVDWCESNKAETVAVNVAGATNAMLAALEAGAYPIQLASGCVYSGDETYAFREDDPPNFSGSFYSRQRLTLEAALEELPVLLARIRMPLSSRPHPRNLITKLVGYQQVISVPNSVTLIDDLYPALETLMTKRPIGKLHLTNHGYIQHADILAAYKRIVDPAHSYQEISVKDLETNLVKAKRSNCVLCNKRAQALGVSMPALDADRLDAIIGTYKQQLTV